MHVAGSYGVLGLDHFPLLVRLDNGPLIQLSSLPIESQRAPGCTQPGEVIAAFGRCRTGGLQLGVFVDVAVTVGAADLDGVASFAVELAVAVRILLEVAVGAVHSF